MTTTDLPQYHLAYALLPYKRNQDIIKVISGKKNSGFVASVVDGWNWKEKLPDDREGRKAARWVAQRYPEISLPWHHFFRAATELDNEFLQRWPKYVSCVGTFLFHFSDSDAIVFVGKGVVLRWDGKGWKKPKKIGDYFLDETKFGFPNEVSRFFGRGELKGDPLYSCKPDIVTLPIQTPVLLASDGVEDVLSFEDINKITKSVTRKTPKTIVSALLSEIQSRGGQKDDISILVRWGV